MVKGENLRVHIFYTPRCLVLTPYFLVFSMGMVQMDGNANFLVSSNGRNVVTLS